MYSNYNKMGRDIILGFLSYFFPNKENWVTKATLKVIMTLVHL